MIVIVLHGVLAILRATRVLQVRPFSAMLGSTFDDTTIAGITYTMRDVYTTSSKEAVLDILTPTLVMLPVWRARPDGGSPIRALAPRATKTGKTGLPRTKHAVRAPHAPHGTRESRMPTKRIDLQCTAFRYWYHCWT